MIEDAETDHAAADHTDLDDAVTDHADENPCIVEPYSSHQYANYTDACTKNQEADAVEDYLEMRCCLLSPVQMESKIETKNSFEDTFKIMMGIFLFLIIVGCVCLAFSLESCWISIRKSLCGDELKNEELTDEE